MLLHGEVAEVMTDSTGLIEVTSHGRVFGPGALLVTRCEGEPKPSLDRIDTM